MEMIGFVAPEKQQIPTTSSPREHPVIVRDSCDVDDKPKKSVRFAESHEQRMYYVSGPMKRIVPRVKSRRKWLKKMMKRAKRKLMNKLTRRKTKKQNDSNGLNAICDHPLAHNGASSHEKTLGPAVPSNDEILQELEQWETKVTVESNDAPRIKHAWRRKKKAFSRPFKPSKTTHLPEKGNGIVQETTKKDFVDLAMARRYIKKSMSTLDQAFDSMTIDPADGESHTVEAFTYASAAKRLIARSKSADSGDRRDTNYEDLIEPIGLSENDDPAPTVFEQSSIVADLFCDTIDCANPTLNKTRLLAMQTALILEEIKDDIKIPNNHGIGKSKSRTHCLPTGETGLAEACSALNDRTCQLSEDDYFWQEREHASIAPMDSQVIFYPAKNSYSQSGIFQGAKKFLHFPNASGRQQSEVTKVPPVEFVQVDSYSTFSSIANQTAATESSSSSGSLFNSDPRSFLRNFT